MFEGAVSEVLHTWFSALHQLKKNLLVCWSIIQDRLPPSEKDNHRLLVGESEMLPESSVHRLDNPSILQGVNHILSDAGQLALKLLTPFSVLLGAEQGDHKLLLLGELGKLSIINSLESVLPSDAAKAYAEEQKFAEHDTLSCRSESSNKS